MPESPDSLDDEHIDAAYAELSQLRNAGGDIDAARTLAAGINRRHGLQPVRLVGGVRITTPGWIAVIGSRGISIWTPGEERARQQAAEGGQSRERVRLANTLDAPVQVVGGEAERAVALEQLWERLDFFARTGPEVPGQAAALGRVAQKAVTQYRLRFGVPPSQEPETVIRGVGWKAVRRGETVEFRWDDEG